MGRGIRLAELKSPKVGAWGPQCPGCLDELPVGWRRQANLEMNNKGEELPLPFCLGVAATSRKMPPKANT